MQNIINLDKLIPEEKKEGSKAPKKVIGPGWDALIFRRLDFAGATPAARLAVLGKLGLSVTSAAFRGSEHDPLWMGIEIESFSPGKSYYGYSQLFSQFHRSQGGRRTGKHQRHPVTGCLE